MLKKTVTYVDFDGETRTETHYFNLTKRDLLKLQSEYPGGMHKLLMKIIAENDNKRIFEYMEDIVQRSYGEKSADGRSHIKNQKVLDAFIHTEAYSQLIVELATNADAATEFINGIIPESIVKETAAEAH